MAAADRPRIRQGLQAAPDDGDRMNFVLWDGWRVSDALIRLTAVELECLNLCDGSRTIRDLQQVVMQWTGGQLVSISFFEKLFSRLDEALFLDSPRYQEKINSDIRSPTCIGCYEGDVVKLRKQLKSIFGGRGASGLPRLCRPDDSLRAVLVPHIDYARGGRTYTWGFREVFEHTPAELFVIIGTSHCSANRFTLTRKHFETPFGIATTDRAYIDKLAARYGDGLFDDEIGAHLPEHSIELEVVFLQYLYEGKRPIRIVPLVVGSFHDAVEAGRPPGEAEDIGRMIEALQAVERDTKEPICYLISGDLAHIGPKFGDRRPLAELQLSRSKEQDHALLRAAEAVDSKAYFQVIAEENDSRRICGLPPTYTVLEALCPGEGKLLDYDQYVHPRGFESVSFASMAFYR